LGKCGYGFAYRICDAQYWGVPQRRRRVFVVGYLGDWRPPAAVLFERQSLRGDYPPCRETREDVAKSLRGRANSSHREDSDNFIAGTLGARTKGGGGLGTDFDLAGGLQVAYSGHDTGISRTLNAGAMGRQDWETETLVTHALSADGFDASEDGTGRGTPLVPVACNESGKGYWREGDVSSTIRKGDMNGGGSARESTLIVPIGFNARQDPDSWDNRTGPLDSDGCSQAVAFQSTQSGIYLNDTDATLDAHNESRRHNGVIAPCLTHNYGKQPDNSDTNAGPMVLPSTSGVRRLTPRECERLQGFEDDWTLVPYRGTPAKDGPRYKAIGNSMAVPVMNWIGKRIQMVEGLINGKDNKI
jgi:DNA (cytosine-5)-methyltransferase 1